MDYEFDKNVPVPAVTKGKPKCGVADKLRRMEVGESFEETVMTRKILGETAVRVGKEMGRRYTVRVQENGLPRVWRVE